MAKFQLPKIYETNLSCTDTSIDTRHSKSYNTGTVEIQEKNIFYNFIYYVYEYEFRNIDMRGIDVYVGSFYFFITFFPLYFHVFYFDPKLAL